MNKYNQINQELDQLINDINKNGQNVLDLSTKIWLLKNHRDALSQSLTKLKAGEDSTAVTHFLKTQIESIKQWLTEQDNLLDDSLEEELTRLEIENNN